MNNLTKHLFKIIITIFVFLMAYTDMSNVQAISIGKEYKTTLEGGISFHVPDDGKYKITVNSIVSPDIQFSDLLYLYVSDDDDETVGDEISLSYGGSVTKDYLLRKGNYWIEFDAEMLTTTESILTYEDLQFSIKVQKIPSKKVSYSKMKKRLKKYSNSYTHYYGKKGKVYLIQDGLGDVDPHENENYVVGMNAFPYIRLYKSGNSSHIKYSIEGKFLYYGDSDEESNLYEFKIGNSRTKKTYKITDCSERIKYNHKGHYYDDTCKWKVTIFSSSISNQKNVEGLIKVLRGKKPYIYIKGENGVYYKIYFDNKSKKQWIKGLQTYKKLLKYYK